MNTLSLDAHCGESGLCRFIKPCCLRVVDSDFIPSSKWSLDIVPAVS